MVRIVPAYFRCSVNVLSLPDSVKLRLIGLEICLRFGLVIRTNIFRITIKINVLY